MPFVLVLACMSCDPDKSTEETLPDIVVAIPQASQSALGYQSILLTSDGKLYMTPAGSSLSDAATFDYYVETVSDPSTGSALTSRAGSEPSGRTSSALTGDNPIIRSRIAAVIIYSLLADPMAPHIDMIDFIFQADSSTGVANVTSTGTSQSAPLTVQATATTAASSSSSTAGASSARREDHSECFASAYEGSANAQRFCDCYYGANTAASQACLPLREGSESWLAEAETMAAQGLVSCSAPQPVDAVRCSRGYFCCQNSNCWQCMGNTADDEHFFTMYCSASQVEHCN